MFLAKLIHLVFWLAYWLIIIRVIVSWLRPSVRDKRVYRLLRLLYDLTEPMLAPIRRLMPSTNIGIDFSPFIAIILLGILERIIVSLIF